jgi:hypothetical protein
MSVQIFHAGMYTLKRLKKPQELLGRTMSSIQRLRTHKERSMWALYAKLIQTAPDKIRNEYVKVENCDENSQSRVALGSSLARRCYPRSGKQLCLPYF